MLVRSLPNEVNLVTRHSLPRTGESSQKRGKSSPRQEIVEAILRRHRDGLPLNCVAILHQERPLYNAVRRVFETWDDAIQAAGLDPSQVRRHRRWDRRAIILRILQLGAEGRPLNARSVQLAEATLANAALRWFRTWGDALKAAGVKPARWCQRVPTWTRHRVMVAIQSIYARGDAVNHAALGRNSVTRAATLLFGSWDNALRAAGLDPTHIRLYRQPWTPEGLLQEIQRKAGAGEPLNARDVSPYSLRRRGCIFFGSWDAALITAGLDPAKVRRSRSRGNRRRRQS